MKGALAASNTSSVATLAKSKNIATEDESDRRSPAPAAMSSAKGSPMLRPQQSTGSSIAQESFISPTTKPFMPPTPALASRDAFTAFDDNPVKRVSDSPVSTFSVDVDAASYGFVRRLLNRGVLPPSNAVRVEELVN